MTVTGKFLPITKAADDVVFLPGDDPDKVEDPAPRHVYKFDDLPAGCYRAACWCTWWIEPNATKDKEKVCAVCGVPKVPVTWADLERWAK